ncbi:MAG: S9 family peptidase [Alphaproteobacteria bacterium]|nr:S9 family peptidase [Alphaproteobacteria bacterium]MDE1985855.1 S9 family peptidase [Alphaproteobacteria bacterium]MDE2163265.1 S9 family peptidase [Alphaproteobacteria bacterium]MDE2264684.1 S9 family peptidase [Alphaproteobacteria bacterium]MDE2498770.1 S9 family peptidase [Alphaproteobacteria bacterium]
MRRFTLLLLGLLIATAATAADMGKIVDDPYLWLEDIHGAKPMEWVHEQNARSVAALKADPSYQKNYDSILSVLDATDRIPYGSLNHQYVFNFWQDAEHPKGVWRRTTIADYANANPHWEILLDLDKLAAEEKENWVWKGADCTPTLTRCLVNLSRGGGDAVVVREFDLAGKNFAKDGFTLTEAKSDVAFLDDNTVFFGTDFGAGSLTTSGYPRIVKLWHRGGAISDAKTVMEGKVTDVAIAAQILRDGDKSVPIIVRAPSFFESEYYLVGTDGGWWKLPVPLSAQLQGLHDGQLLFTLREDWSPNGKHIGKGSLIAFALKDATADKLPPVDVLYALGRRSSIESVATGRDAVYVSIYDNVVGAIHAFRYADGKWTDKKLDLPPGGSTSIISANDSGPEAYFGFESFLKPPTLYADGGDDRPVEIKSLPARFDASGLETTQYEATAKDGTKVPYFVVRAKSAKGPRPTILYGYGGFEISLTPSYSANMGMLWLTKGGTYVLANIRGGGEFGPAWHEAALKYHRQRAFDDFAAVAADIEKRGITTPAQLGIMGGSNGGLLVSTVMTQHPELLGAVVCQVPLIDMIRYTHIGAGASWIAEYGDPADPRMAAYIRTYSPYQNVSVKKKYPPVFFVTATSDDRVTPVHARKMAAKMEAQGHSVMFYENTDGGHAAAANHKQAAEMWALSFVYLARELEL